MAALRIPADEFAARARRVRLLLLDVDGVLTDGRIVLDDHGVESKEFFVRDGSAIALWRRSGHAAAILSGRSSRCVDLRAAELGIDPVVQGAKDKGAALDGILAGLGLSADQVGFVGDDLPDLPVLLRAGLAACPADAPAVVREHAHLVTDAPGGRGAVREVVELVLDAQGLWSPLVASFLAAEHTPSTLATPAQPPQPAHPHAETP
jgi:3-deoxy-D-manno-octulosonate 8-phosphate phosphatase (KDO 8-P phosphatase)